MGLSGRPERTDRVPLLHGLAFLSLPGGTGDRLGRQRGSSGEGGSQRPGVSSGFRTTERRPFPAAIIHPSTVSAHLRQAAGTAAVPQSRQSWHGDTRERFPYSRSTHQWDPSQHRDSWHACVCAQDHSCSCAWGGGPICEVGSGYNTACCPSARHVHPFRAKRTCCCDAPCHNSGGPAGRSARTCTRARGKREVRGRNIGNVAPAPRC